ncbi:MAG: ABC transporter ATP-binding protein [Parvularculaceae bacterium]|nr:ABC transporter ATP-binding protein [Parvularculaceae bacterium]
MFRFLEGLLNPFPETRLGPPPQGLVRFCWHFTRDARGWLAALAILTVMIAVGEVFLFAFLGRIVDWLAAADRARFLEREGRTLVGMGALILVGLPLASFFHTSIVHQILLGNLPMSARWRMHRHLLGQSMAFYANEFAGRVATKVMQTALAVRETVMKLLDVFVYVAVYFVTMIGMVASAYWRLAAPLLAWLGVYLALLAFFIPRLKNVAEAQADARSVMTGRIVDSYTNIGTVKLFAHAGREEAYARESMEQFLGTVHPQMRLVTLLNTAVYFNNSLAVFMIAALSIGLWLNSLVSVGAIAAAIALALRLNGMSQWIMWEVSGLFENIGTVYDGMETLTRRLDVVDAPGARRLERPRGEIRFERVTFHYGKDDGVIGDFTLTIAPGEKVGLVGRSGAGKTTLMNLLLRFYDVEGGRILIDGEDVRSVTQESLRAQIGVVTQDTSLLHRSIRDNIAYGRPGASEEAIREAARRANALGFIEALEDSRGRKGLDAHVGERGVKLSGGQRQRIAIARVFLKDAPILVLDEATSALDSEIEAAIQENLFQLMKGKTVIAIAHRLSTIAQLDRLVVIDKGRIVEDGPHRALVAKGGLYADLWARQSGGFIAGDAEIATAD